MLKRYRYRAYLTPGQEQDARRTLGCCRVVFNDFLAERERLFRSGDAKGVPMSQTVHRVTTVAKTTPERAWLTEVSSVTLQQSIADAQRAYRNFFDGITGVRKNRMGKPRFRSRHDSRQSARFTRNSGFVVAETTHGVAKVRLPKIGWVRFTLSRPLPSVPSSVTLISESGGAWFVSFVVNVPAREAVPPEHQRAAALDLGMIDFAAIAYSDGTREKIANPKPLKAAQRKLTKAQRSVSRKRKGSANRTKAKVKVARLHRRVADTRADFHHQLASRLVRENQAVAVEKLKVSGIARSMGKGAAGRGFRRSVHDTGWGNFLRILTEKTDGHGRTLVRVNPAYTSQTCSVCGVLDGPKPLGVRIWTCGSCDARLDRDFNAAVNIMVAAGLAETQNVCGADVRRALASAIGDEAETHRTFSGVAA